MRPSRRRREAALESWCVAWARARGIVTSRLKDPVGIPDHCFWPPGGVPWLVEFKDPQADLLDPHEGIHDNQWWYLIVLRAAGYRTAVVTTKEGFLRLMNGA
jgi:hypothetical protein